MITKQDDLLGTLIHDVAHLLRLDIDRRVQNKNITRVKWLALGVIAKKPGLTQQELAEELELGSAAVGRLVDRLVERKFVVRRPHPEDRRAYVLNVTDTAVDLLVRLEGTGKKMRKELLKGLSDSEVQKMNKGLKRLKNNLQRLSAIATIPFFGSKQLTILFHHNLPFAL